MVISTVDQWQG